MFSFQNPLLFLVVEMTEQLFLELPSPLHEVPLPIEDHEVQVPCGPVPSVPVVSSLLPWQRLDVQIPLFDLAQF